jgi:hypothetical protein
MFYMAQRVSEFLSSTYKMKKEDADKHTHNVFDYIDTLAKERNATLSENQKADIAIKAMRNMHQSIAKETAAKIISKYEVDLPKIADFCKKNPETFYAPLYFPTVLELSVNPRGIATALTRRLGEFGLTKIEDISDPHNAAFYGYSQICGSRECFKDWCEGQTLNPCKNIGAKFKRKFVKKDGTAEEIII